MTVQRRFEALKGFKARRRIYCLRSVCVLGGAAGDISASLKCGMFLFSKPESFAIPKEPPSAMHASATNCTASSPYDTDDTASSPGNWAWPTAAASCESIQGLVLKRVMRMSKAGLVYVYICSVRGRIHQYIHDCTYRYTYIYI